MRTVGISMMFALLVSGASACGGDDGGNDTNTDNNSDDADDTADDDIVVDDTSDDTTDDTTDDSTPPDAPPSSGAEGIGKVCVRAMMGADCPASAPSCVALAAGPNGFCTAACGTSADNMTVPPNGNATCSAVAPAVPSGTPACVLYGEAMNGQVPWACGILCGTVDNMGTPVELGDCPTGLTCTANLCQP